MKGFSILSVVKSYAAAILTITVMALLVAEKYFFMADITPWTGALWGCLVVVLLTLNGQFIYIMRKSNKDEVQLAVAKERLLNEIKHRHWAEKSSSEGKEKLQFVEDNLPVLFAYFTTSQRCRFHNRAYRKWFGLKSSQINGHLLQEFSSPEFCLTIRTCIKDILAGRIVFNESMQNSAQGKPCQLAEQIIPHFDNKRKVVGFYMLYTPRASDNSRILTKRNTAEPASLSSQSEAANMVATTDNDKVSDSELSAGHIIRAIDEGEFQLYCQRIVPVKTDSTLPIQYEVLLRMAEEENNLLPPGAFLPSVERYNLMPRLDCWVVERVAKWLKDRAENFDTIYCINVARSTLGHADFPKYVRSLLKRTKIAPNLLCFEIEEADVLDDINASQAFVQEIRKLGCLVSLCSFNYTLASLSILKKIDVNYLKIDGSLICNILRDEEDLTKIIAITKMAQKNNIVTIAELVEDSEVIIKLNEIDVDYAQGFGVATPIPLEKT
jgi:EAL domain-containing protein (putative c-di-GMP-specific phosphodiesterase class I)/PAS domain-containing protein